jgi:hypothetical protein
MLHACVERFNVMGGRGNILGWDGEVNKTYMYILSKLFMHIIIALYFRNRENSRGY